MNAPLSSACRWGVALLMLAALVPASGSEPASLAGSKWRIGTPIVTYWAGPASHNELNDTTAAQLAAGGWNLGWADEPEHLDIFHRHGMRAMLELGANWDPNDPAQAKALDEKIARMRDHPALYAHYLKDEPGATAFAALGRLVAYLRERDPAHMAYINLFPTYASPKGQLETEGDTVTAYREHLRQFVEKVKPDLLSYDHYPFAGVGSGQWFLNLALMREAALKAGVPFMNIFQAGEFYLDNWAVPTEGQIRWQTYTSLAYGAQGISHFVYNCRPCQKSAFFQDCPESEVPLPIYWATSRINRDFVTIATELQPLRSLGAYHVGKVPEGAKALPSDSRFKVEHLAKPPGILLGSFGKSANNSSHVLVVNLDYNKSTMARLIGPGPLEIFHAPTRTWTPSPRGVRVRLDLAPGGGRLVRLQQ